MIMIMRIFVLGMGLMFCVPAQAAMRDSEKKVIILKDCDALEMTQAENKTRDLLIQYMQEVYRVTEENIKLKRELARVLRKKK